MMRQYETDSTQAAARILAHAVLADGGLDKAELDSLARSEVFVRLGMDRQDFDRVLQEYVHDLLMGADYLDSVHLRLDPSVVPAMLDEIRDPAFQSVLLDAIVEIVHADGVSTDEELSLVQQANSRWRGDAPAMQT